jgi:DNA-binding phage protein
MGKIKLYKWDAADYLDDEEDIADFLADLLADNDEAMTRSALDTARRARIRLGLPAVAPEDDIARASRTFSLGKPS